MESTIEGLLAPLQTIRRWFWSEYVWLPPNVTWAMYENRSVIKYPVYSHLYYSIITAFILIFVRLIFERFLFTPIGLRIGLKRVRSKQAPHNDILEKAFSSNTSLDHKQIVGLSKQLDWSERQVERWLRIRKSRDKQTSLSKFTESAWRCTFYSFAFTYGVYTLYGKPWLWDSTYCFLEYPHHGVSNEEWYYYNLELGFYLSLIVSQFFDIKRKDFVQMFIHHLVTLMLICFSWACNLHRTGTLVMIIHDFADIPLEGAKLTRYARTPNASNVIFAVFTVAWIYSRLGLLPYRVIAYSSYYALNMVPMFPAYYIFNGLLIALQILHVIWTWLILRIAHNAMFKDGVKDLRESDDTTIDESSEMEQFPPVSTSKAGNGFGSHQPNGGDRSYNKALNGDVRSRQTAAATNDITSTNTTHQ